ncbi:hypothetical protein FACS1894120_3970 [Clostridia bacterium]|nr:hypothetical protein FACS1894120_3970 [Clostridia bacterium]
MYRIIKNGNNNITQIESQRKHAHEVINTFAAVAFAEGIVPVPFADTAMLVPTEISMFIAIADIYGVKLPKAVVTAVASSLLGSAGAVVAGKTVVSGVLKIIPGIGSVVGGAISAGTAAVVTVAMGRAFMRILEIFVQGEQSERELIEAAESDDVVNMLRSDLHSGHGRI